MINNREILITYERLKQGLYALDDTTKAPFGSARIMKNMMITDRGGISPRPGTQILGTNNTSGFGCKGFYNYQKSFNSDEILVKVYDTFMEGYSKNLASAGWFRIKTDATSDKDTGFVSALLNTDNEDYLIFGNRYDNFSSWTGAITQLNGALVGGETTITVDTTLTGEIYQNLTATGSSATTLSVAGTPWATSQWINLYVYITSGALSGKIRKITACTSSQITFDTLGGDPGLCTFQIRKNLFPATGSIVYNNVTVAYTAIDTATTFTVSSASAAPSRSVVSNVIATYPANPRGSRFANYLGRMVVANVRSAIALGSGGTAQGYLAGGNYYVSKIKNPFDYTYSATRVAGDGDFQPTPFGGGDILDAATQEDSFYIFKRNYIEQVQYAQTADDTVNRTPLKAGIGSINRVIKGADDIYFMTPDKRFTSIGRAKLRDIKPHTENIGINIKRLLDEYDFSNVSGIEYKNRILIACKSSSTVRNNDIIIVWNKETGAFEGIWDIPASGFAIWQDTNLYYAESSSANVYQMFTTQSADVNGTTRFPIVSEYASQFLNLTPVRRNFLKMRAGDLQSSHAFYYEGYIKGGTTITFKAWKDFSEQPFLQFDFSGTETAFEDASTANAFLGGDPIGLSPQGALGPVEADGRRHFAFRVYFPYQYANYFSVGFNSNGADLDYEVTRIGLGIATDPAIDTSRIKTI